MIMKTVRTILALAGLLLTVGVYSQELEGKLWVTISNSTDIPSLNSEGDLEVTNNTLSSLISDFDITRVEQALPSSRQSHLQHVYEVTCNCDEQDLYKAISEEISVWSKPEIAPKYELLHTPDDYNLEFSEDYALDMIKAEGAWEFTTGDTNVVIGISDGNYFLNHEELVGEYTYVAPNITSPYYEHGTAVAALAAGNTNNGVGKSSIGYDCKLSLVGMNYNQVLDLSYMGVRVINLSWSSGCWFNQYTQDVINECYDNGTIIVAAAGNGSTCGGASNLVYPAAHDHVIAVSSVGRYDNHEDVIGDPSTCHQHNSSVDICAPGYNVPLTAGPGWYLGAWGTSFAAPQVSGTIGLMLSVNPCLTYEDVLDILTMTAVNIDAQNPNYIGMLGAGRLDAASAVKIALEYGCDGGGLNSGNSNNNTNGGVTVGDNTGTIGTSVYSDSEGFNSSASYNYASIEDLQGETLTVYPNPSNGLFTISAMSGSDLSYMITDMHGRVVYTLQTNNTVFTIDLSSQTSGVYYLRVSDLSGRHLMKKLIKE